MARPLRIEIANGLYHVTTRGWERRVIVRSDRDRKDWFRLLSDAATRSGWRVFASVLMSNHFHLFLRTPEPNLSAGMHDLNSGYASLFNRRHRRVGSLFQGRFKAILVEDESHSWELSRYVHLNPVRARIVARPADYRWSSYQGYMDRRKAPDWLDWETVVLQHGHNLTRARRAYRQFVEAGIGQRIRSRLEKWLVSKKAKPYSQRHSSTKLTFDSLTRMINRRGTIKAISLQLLRKQCGAS